jgi:hypothetical protein
MQSDAIAGFPSPSPTVAVVVRFEPAEWGNRHREQESHAGFGMNAAPVR